MNPGGSVKDRIAKAMIETAEASGQLTPDKTVLEATSGNTGIGLAMVCAAKGYKLLLTMSEAVSIERRRILEALGAEIRLTPGRMGTDGAIEEAYRLARERADIYFMTDQFNNEANWRAHYEGTGVEIWEQTAGQVTMLVATMGTTGTIMGTSRRLKEYNPDICIVGVEPYLGHKIQGLKNMKESYQPEIYEKSRIDRKVNVDDEVAFDMARRLAKEEGLFVGMSSGAAMAIAREEVKSLKAGMVVVILGDGGERYLSTPLFAPRQTTNLRFHNISTRSKDPLLPVQPGNISMYTCGPTVHDRMHIGEARRFILADLIHRYLEYRGYRVTHVMGITDVDDKTIQASEEAGMELKPFTDGYVEAFYEDMAALGTKSNVRYPRGSEHMDDIVRLTARLVEKGYAYEKLQSVYFDISRCEDYGVLSGINLDKIKLGSTVDLDEYEKANPRDFALLKRAKLSELKRGIYTKTDWGNVRPSWHIESTVMATQYLGETFDIYTSNIDFVFPHHENENALSKALTGQQLARCWVCTEPVLFGGKKVQTGNDTLRIGDLLRQGYEGRVIRYWLLSHNYRKPLHFSFEALEQAKGALQRLDQCMQALSNCQGGTPYGELDQLLYDVKTGFSNAMDDDLDIAAALAALFKSVRTINQLLAEERLDASGAQRIRNRFKQVDGVLRIIHFEEKPVDVTVQALMKERQEARQNKDWERADAIRDQLKEMGIEIKDKTRV
jgi:cysteinyl-tRNA synthetase